MGSHRSTTRQHHPPDQGRNGAGPPPGHALARSGRRHGLMASGVMLACVTLGGCGGGDEAGSTESALDVAAAESAGGDAIAIDTAGPSEQPVASSAVDPGVIDPGVIDLGVIGRDVVIELQVLMTSDDIERSVSAIGARAAALGGGLASSDVDFGDRTLDDPTLDDTDGSGANEGHAVLVVKVPPDAVDRLMSGLNETGRVRSISQSAQDVTEQLVDLDVRIANARTSVDNVRAFMDRAQNLGELVSLEAELTRRQTELEQLEAQQRNLSDRVALSTITIEIVPTAALPQPVDDQGLGDAFHDGWAAFMTVAFGIAYAGAVLAPFLVVGAIVAVLGWGAVRRRSGPRWHRAAGPDRASRAAPTGDVPNESIDESIDQSITEPVGASRGPVD